MVTESVFSQKKSKVKVKLLWPNGYKDEYKTHHCMLGISVGQPKHEGPKLEATLEKINNNFSKCTIMLADTLQRYSIKANNPNISIDEAYTQAVSMGDNWIIRNIEQVKKLDIDYEIKRWDSWLLHPDYADCRKVIEMLSDEDNEFHMAVFESIKEIALRFDKRKTRFDCISLFKYSPDYVKEECAVQLLMANEGYNFIAYPGGCNFAMKKTYSSVVEPMFQNKFDWLDIKIKS